MPRYIDADLIDFSCLLDTICQAQAEEVIDEQPTADVVEVVRCKDCKHRDADDFCTGRGYPNALVPDDGFCDKGERREK